MAENVGNTKKDSVTIGTDTLYGAAIVILACLLVVSIFTQGFGVVKPVTTCPVCNTTCPSGTGNLANNTQPTQPSTPGLSVAVGNYPALGQASAPVTIVQFSDFQCPYCSRLYGDAEAGIRTNYVSSGKVQIYFRNFPLSFHPNAMPAAIAAGCAAAQNQFWAMHDELFSNQANWSGASDPSSYFYQYAQAIGLNNATFASCYASQTPLNAINADEAEGQTYGVQGTPASFIIVPKSKISNDTISSAVSALNQQYGAGALTLYENTDDYIVLVPGAFPYAAFDAVLSKVSY